MNSIAAPQLVSLDPKALSRTPLAGQTAAPEADTAAKQEKKRGFSFGDFIDMINPLQHIPIINTIYRAITGDTIRPEAKLVGGGLFGGPLGLALSAADVALEAETGRDAGGHVMAMLQGGEKTPKDTPVLVPQGAQPVMAAAMPQLTEAQWQSVVQSLEAPKKADKKSPPAPHADIERAAARQAAYTQALSTMAATLAQARTLDRLPDSARVEVGALTPL